MRWLIVIIFAVSCAVAEEDEIAALEKRISELERELEECDECESELAKAQYDLMLCQSMED